MSRLRRLVLSDRFFFLTVKLLPKRRLVDESQFTLLARCLSVVRARRQFRLTAWVLLPDHWHVILFPRHPLTISDAMKSIKLSSTNLLSRHRGEAGELWQGRFFDGALRTVKEYAETLEYIHFNPVRRGLVGHPAQWKWSSYHEYAGVSAVEQGRRCGLIIDRVQLPSEGSAQI
jgi:putative transposase